MISAGVLLSALAAASPAKPPPTMTILGCDMVISLPFLSANSIRTLDHDAPFMRPLPVVLLGQSSARVSPKTPQVLPCYPLTAVARRILRSLISRPVAETHE